MLKQSAVDRERLDLAERCAELAIHLSVTRMIPTSIEAREIDTVVRSLREIAYEIEYCVRRGLYKV